MQHVLMTNVCHSRCAVIFTSASAGMLVWQHDAVFCRWYSWELPARRAIAVAISERERGADGHSRLVRDASNVFSGDLIELHWVT